MNIIEFLKFVTDLKANCGLDCVDPNYYIFIHNGLKKATVNRVGYINMVDVAYIIVVSPYRWKNLGYTNTSLTQLLMVDNQFNPVESIPFGKWNFKGLNFTTHPGNYYNAWKPYPKLELSSNESINNFERKPIDELEMFPKWEWPGSIDNITELLKSIHEFTQQNNQF